MGSESPGISAGAIAGIAVGVAALLIGILVASFFVWRVRRRGDPGSHLGTIKSQRSLPPGYSESTSPAELKHHTILYTGWVDQHSPCDVRFSHGSGATVRAELGSDGPIELPGPEASPRELMSKAMLMEDEPKQDGQERDDPGGGLGENPSKKSEDE